MAKITHIGEIKKASPGENCACEHKYVTVYAVPRTVHCVTCGAGLDPFDVLLDLTKGGLPGIPERDEERALALEIVRRQNKTKKKESPERE